MTAPSARRSPVRASPRPRTPDRELSRLGWPILGLLAVQFLLGMGLNLYVVLPSGSVGAILASSPVLILHVLVALFLIGISARALLLAWRLRARRALAGGILALLSALVATGAGVSFTFGTGGAGASYAMSIGFVGMLIGAAALVPGFPRPGENPRAQGPGDRLGAGSEP